MNLLTWWCTDPVPASREVALQKAGIVTYHGTARFTGEDRLAVAGRELEARHFVSRQWGGTQAARHPRRGTPADEH